MPSMLPISLRGARTHNLKNVDLCLQPGDLVALVGPSGAGKSSLALDTLYAEGQRRFVESFSPYARQFLERLPRPDADGIDPVSAAVAVDQKGPSKSSRSTLATLTDIEPYLGALFAAEAVPVCPACGLPAQESSPAQAAARIISQCPGQAAVVVFPAGDSEEAALAIPKLRAAGFLRLLLDGALFNLEGNLEGNTLPHAAQVEVVADRLVLSDGDQARLVEAIELCHRHAARAEVRLAKTLGAGRKTDPEQTTQRFFIAKKLHCPGCARTFEPPHARLFSYNSPLGACPACKGFGRTIGLDWDKIIPDDSKSIVQGAIRAFGGKSSQYERAALVVFAQKNDLPLDKPWKQLTAQQRQLVLDGEGTWDDGKYPGVRAWFQFLESRTYKMHVRVLLSRYRAYTPCVACQGQRLNPVALSYRVAQKNLADWQQETVQDLLERLASFSARTPQGRFALQALQTRLRYLAQVGLGYLTLDRPARTLSVGEAQRASLTGALGAGLVGTLFVLDQPSLGLHPTDVPKLGQAVRGLSDQGNTVLLVEHDPALIATCRRVIELGPGAGRQGGRIVYDGEPVGGLSRMFAPPKPAGPDRRGTAGPDRSGRTDHIEIRGATENNLQDVDVDIPLCGLVAVTGPSGSGKTSLVQDVLYRGLARRFGDTTVEKPGACRQLRVPGSIKNVVLVDQTPLGRTARGNAATYTKAWDRFRARLAAQPEAQASGLTAAHFSFNVAKGRCPGCDGEGFETVEMQFLADVSLLCPLCQGKRFRPEVLAVRLDGLSAAELLELPVQEALDRFASTPDPALTRALAPLVRVGLGYLPLGQPLSTLSGGEAQRLKLSRALSQSAQNTLFVFDEPSAGLHPADVAQVVAALRALCVAGGSVVVVEHNLAVIAQADFVIDLGPGAGPQGGRIVACAPPAELAELSTKTGQALAARRHPAAPVPQSAPPPGIQAITVENAREHNLRNVSCRIPHGSFTVVTGPSGSGKSSLCFDVIFAEGQRRFMDTLSPYARQFLPELPRPDVDFVGGVPPSIALSQHNRRALAHSTVATITEVAHYLRLLFAKVGVPYCPDCQMPAEAADGLTLLSLFESLGEAPHTLFAPAVVGRKGTYLDLFVAARAAGVLRARVDGQIVDLDPPPRLHKNAEHRIDLLIKQGRPRDFTWADVERALSFSRGSVLVSPGYAQHPDPKTERLYCRERACPSCGLGIPELDPRCFSFQVKQGQCAGCEGRGLVDEHTPCTACLGTRLGPIPRNVRLMGHTYPALLMLPVEKTLQQVASWEFSPQDRALADAPQKELLRRLRFIDQIGLGYLSLDRAASTLSGGELQRLRLSAQLGAGLTGALYVLDEPTIGLHPRDTRRLIDNLHSLKELGSTVVVIEHDEAVIRAADQLIDLGPSGGKHGGTIVAQGTVSAVLQNPASPTAQALAEKPTGNGRRPRAHQALVLRGANLHNLKNVTLSLPLGRFNVVAGVSGSGKSTLVQKVLYPALRQTLGLALPTDAKPPAGVTLEGTGPVQRALLVDQAPIGRTPRSVPATFLAIWDEIRRLFASLPESKVRGFKGARFSFNTATGGRCPACEGQGVQISEMSFLPDVISPCETCLGQRFEPATLSIRYRGLTIAEVLHLSAEEALQRFAHHPSITRALSTLCELGLSYIQLGQGSHTLSGGEAQRLKLAAELTALTKHQPTVYVLDEPTTGLHLSDVRRLIGFLQKLVDRGDTLVVIEHHPEVLAVSDWVVELGPAAGERGGEIVFAGPPTALARTHTPTASFVSAPC